jgi:arylsulfatase A-like enzyme
MSYNNLTWSTRSHPHNPHISIVDDVGTADVGWNNNLMPTPFLNQLVKQEAIRLSNYYVHPVCTPSRAALLTGMCQCHTHTHTPSCNPIQSSVKVLG